MRLTADVLLRAENLLNTLREREIILRGFKIPAIENLAVLQDQFDIIDFSDNEIKKLANFPKMKRLSILLMNNNFVSQVGSELNQFLIGLTSLILTNNRIARFSEIEHISSLSTLEHLSLLENPISLDPLYRTFTIMKIPTLKTLDFVRVSPKERELAKKFFKSEQGKAFLVRVSEEKSTGVAASGTGAGAGGGGGGGAGRTPQQPLILTEEQKKQVREAVQAATSRDEIDRIEKQLRAGTFLFKPQSSSLPVLPSNSTTNSTSNSSSSSTSSSSSDPAPLSPKRPLPTSTTTSSSTEPSSQNNKFNSSNIKDDDDVEFADQDVPEDPSTKRSRSEFN